MPTHLTEEQEIIASHIAATRAAFQILIKALEDNELLDRHQYLNLLDTYIDESERRHPKVVLALLNDLSLALTD